MAELSGHLGPLPLPDGYGTVTAKDRAEVFEETGCSVSVRFRSQWGSRMLTVNGPCSKLQEAYTLALALIRKNGVEGGRAPEWGSNSSGERAQSSWQHQRRSSWQHQRRWPQQQQQSAQQERRWAQQQQQLQQHAWPAYWTWPVWQPNLKSAPPPAPHRAPQATPTAVRGRSRRSPSSTSSYSYGTPNEEGAPANEEDPPANEKGAPAQPEEEGSPSQPEEEGAPQENEPGKAEEDSSTTPTEDPPTVDTSTEEDAPGKPKAMPAKPKPPAVPPPAHLVYGQTPPPADSLQPTPPAVPPPGKAEEDASTKPGKAEEDASTKPTEEDAPPEPKAMPFKPTEEGAEQDGRSSQRIIPAT